MLQASQHHKTAHFDLALGGEPDPRHLQKMAVAASFRT